MADWLRLRRLAEKPFSRGGYEAIYANEAGDLRHVAVDGTESALGSGGGLPSQWTIDAHGAAVIEPDDPTAEGLFTIAAPADFENQTNGNGDLLLLLAGDDTQILEVDTYGNITVKSATGPAAALRLNRLDTQHIATLTDSSLTFSDHGVPVAQITNNARFIGESLQLSQDDADAALVTITASAAPTALGAENLLEVWGGNGPLVTFPFNGGLFVWDGEGSDTGNLSWWIYQGWEAMTHQVEPEDSQIAPGQVFSFYDASNGAAKFVRKGKTLDGTVVRVESNMT